MLETYVHPLPWPSSLDLKELDWAGLGRSVVL